MRRIKISSIPIFYKQSLKVVINQSVKNLYFLERRPRRIYILYFLVQRVPTVRTPTSFSPSYSPPFFSLSLSFFLSFLSLFLFLLLSFQPLPSSTNLSPPPFIDFPTCMLGDTWLAMCPTYRYFYMWLEMYHPTLIVLKNVKFRLSHN